MIIAPPNPESRQITELVTDLERRMKRAEAGLRAAQLKNGSITDGGLNIYDGDGTLRTILGRQRDGTYNSVSTNNPNPPPVPAAGIAIPALASIIARHTGETATGVPFPADFSHLNIWYAPLQNPDDWTGGGSLLKFPDELPIAPLEYTTYLVAFSAVNLSGKESAKSEPVSASPTQVVPNDLIEGIFADLELSAGQVTEAALAAGAVTETKIAPDSIASPMVKAGAILGVHILADQIDGGKLIAQAITSREIKALAVIAGKIDVNAVTAGTIAAGAVTAVKIESNLIITNRFIAGSLSGNRVELHPLQGLQAFTGGGTTRSFWIDAATGAALLIGEIRTAVSGTRIIMNPGGTNPDRIQFWPDGAGGTADFAYIDSFPDGTVDTGITMQASGGAAGKVGTVWLRKAFAQLGIASNNLSASSQFYAEPNFVRAKSATVDLIIDQAIAPINGPRRVSFINADTAGNPIPSGHLQYMHSADTQPRPWLWGVNQNCGLKFSGNELNVTTGDSMVFGTIKAAIVAQTSSRLVKRDITTPSFANGLSSLDVIERVNSKEWKYNWNRSEKPKNPDGSPLLWEKDGETQEAEWIVDPTPEQRHWFPIAEELAAIDPSLVIHGERPEDMSVDLRDMVGILWDALNKTIKRLREVESRIPPKKDPDK